MVGVRAVSFEEIQGKAGGGAVGEETDDDQRKNLRWETGAFQKIFKKPGDQIQKAGGPEDSHRRQKAHQRGQDPERRVKAALCSLHESLIDISAFQKAVGDHIENKKRKNICR